MPDDFPSIGVVGDLIPRYGVTMDGDAITIEEAVRLIMADDANVAGIVSTRVYPNLMPQGGVLPAITYQVISTTRQYTTQFQDSLVNKRFQINCWATTYAVCNNLANIVRHLLSGYSGTVENRVIAAIFLDSEGDMPNLSPELQQLRRYGKRFDFIVWYRETI